MKKTYKIIVNKLIIAHSILAVVKVVKLSLFNIVH
jgi:hypothetical protein